MRKELLALLLVLSLSIPLPLVAFGSSSNTLNANVAVVCPFSLSENALPFYTIGNSIALTYMIATQAQCTIPSMEGSFALEYSSNGMPVITDLLSTTVTQTNTIYNLPVINSADLQPGISYIAATGFSTFGAINESSETFLLVSPVNIIVSGFSVSPSSTSLGSPITFTVNVLNDGQLASGAIGFNIVITGPQSFTISEAVSALDPGQSEQLSFVLSNVATAAGVYSAEAYAAFISNGVPLQSNAESAAYSVIAPPIVSPPSPAPLPPPPSAVVTEIPQLLFTQLPFYSSLVLGSTSITSLGIKDIIDLPEYVNITIPKGYSSIFHLSAPNVYLVPSESLLVQLVFNSQSTQMPGTYVIPVNLSISGQGITPVNRTQYITYIVSKGSYNTSMYSSLFTSQNNVTDSISLVGASNSSLTNATLITYLPSAVVSNLSQITTYGAPATVTIVNGSPQINWLVPYLPPSKTVTLSYTISNPSSVGLLETVQNLLVETSKPSPASILRVLSIQAPTLYANTIGKITVSTLYTGSSQQFVTFTLATTGSATIQHSIQAVNASPNQLLEQTFYVRAGNTTGTLLFSLSIETPNASLEYSIPVLVLPVSAVPTSTIAQASAYSKALRYTPIVVGAIVLAAAAATAQRWMKRPKYKVDREKELIRVREQIKRSDEGNA
jgi:hypothetical protein